MQITLHKFVGTIAYWAYCLAPLHKPRKIEAVMEKVVDFAMHDFEQPIPHDKTFYLKDIPEDELYGYVDRLMKGIPEFREWNLSQKEFEQHVNVDDPNRSKMVFVTGYDIRDEESWKDDFIDLDAFVQDVCSTLDPRKE